MNTILPLRGDARPNVKSVEIQRKNIKRLLTFNLGHIINPIR